MSCNQQRLDQQEQQQQQSLDEDIKKYPYTSDSFWWRNAKLYDLNRVELPQYNNDLCMQFEKLDTNDCGDRTSLLDGTYILFPQKGKSIPISSVADKLRRLVVLDIKWSKPALITTNNPSLAGLPLVHLDSPPKESHFWRWHNKGDGMLSTAEAIYYAALEVTASSSRRGWTDDKRNRMIDVMWLFALQRSIVGRRNSEAGVPTAYSREGKARQVAVRVRKDGKGQSAQRKRSQKASFYDSNIPNGVVG